MDSESWIKVYFRSELISKGGRRCINEVKILEYSNRSRQRYLELEINKIDPGADKFLGLLESRS